MKKSECVVVHMADAISSPDASQLGGFLKDFFLGFENMGDRGWAGNALFGPWGGVTWAQLRYAGDGDSQFAWGSHEKAEKCDRV